MNREIALIRAPSVLGLKPGGVELLPGALEEAGLKTLPGIHGARTVAPPPYRHARDRGTGMLNPRGIAGYSVRLADAVQDCVQRAMFPLVLGGDCSIIVGAMLALRRLGRYGLFFLDGHADFYQPEASPTGEAADMDLALVSGRGPDIIVNIEGKKPLVRDEDIVLFGQRDREETLKYGSRQVAETPITVFELATIRENGLGPSVRDALAKLSGSPAGGFWVHVDADVIDDDEMPAVDYRLPGGLRFDELSLVLDALFSSGRVAGMSVSIFNPLLDPLEQIAPKLAQTIAGAFAALPKR